MCTVCDRRAAPASLGRILCQTGFQMAVTQWFESLVEPFESVSKFRQWPPAGWSSDNAGSTGLVDRFFCSLEKERRKKNPECRLKFGVRRQNAARAASVARRLSGGEPDG